jgi:hypothetical protein
MRRGKKVISFTRPADWCDGGNRKPGMRPPEAGARRPVHGPVLPIVFSIVSHCSCANGISLVPAKLYIADGIDFHCRSIVFIFGLPPDRWTG